MMNKKILLLSMTLGSTLLITGCTREPNQDELQTLYVEKVQQTNQIAANIMRQKGDIIEVQNFEKIDCNQISNSKDYLCRAKVSIKMPFLGVQKNTTDLHVSKSESGWVIID